MHTSTPLGGNSNPPLHPPEQPVVSPIRRNTVTVAELITLLADMPSDSEVRVMTQPHYPFEHKLDGVWEVDAEPDACGGCGLVNSDPIHEWSNIKGHEFEPYDTERFVPHGDTGGGYVYLVEGTSLGYGTRRAWESAHRT